MTIQWGDTGKVYTGVLKTFTMNQPNPRETLSGSPTSLPTTNPTNSGAQVSFTIQQSDLPTMAPDVASKQYCALVIVGGKNADAATQTVNSQIYQNGTSKGTASSSVTTNTFWTHNLYFTNNVNVGDTINVSLWATSVNVNYDYICLMVIMTKILYVPRQSIMTNFSVVTASDVHPTLGTPQASSSAPYNIYLTPSALGNTTVGMSGNGNLDTLKAVNTTFNLVASYFDTQQSNFTSTNATNRPQYRTIYYPKTVSFREIGRW